jgi:hypothetical protein
MTEKLEIVIIADDKASGKIGKVGKSAGGLSTVFTQLIPGASKTTGALESMGGMMTKLAPSIGVSAEAAAGMSASLVAMAGPIAAVIAAVGIATVAFTGMAKAVNFALAEAEAAQKVEVQLETQIKATGGAAGLTAEQIKTMASEMSQLTGVADDNIIASANVLLRFDQIGKNVFPQAQQAALDLSAAMGTDLSTAALMLGRALQDPESGMTALRRAGIMFDEQMIKGMQSMAEHGQGARAQGLILAEVARLVGGSAEAMGGTVAGEAAKIRNLLGEMGEEFGKAFLPLKGDALVIVREFLTMLTQNLQPAMALLRNEMRTLQAAFREPETKKAIQELTKAMAEWLGEGALNSVKVMASAVKDFLRDWKIHGPETVRAITTIVTAMRDMAIVVGRVLDLMDRLGISSSKVATGQFASAGVGALRGYASGVTTAPGGLAWVGENGPEPVFLPRGSTVLSNSEARSALSGAGGGSFNNYGTLNFDVKDQVTFFDLLRQARTMGGAA